MKEVDIEKNILTIFQFKLHARIFAHSFHYVSQHELLSRISLPYPLARQSLTHRPQYYT